MKAAQDETHAATILITHDLGLIAELADRVVVMYAGRVVELADVFEIFNSPRHPYTVGLDEHARAARCRPRVARSDPRPAPEHDLASSGLRISSAVRPLAGPRGLPDRRSGAPARSARAATTSRHATSPKSSPRSTSSARSWRTPRERDAGADSGGARASGRPAAETSFSASRASSSTSRSRPGSSSTRSDRCRRSPASTSPFEPARRSASSASPGAARRRSAGRSSS